MDRGTTEPYRFTTNFDHIDDAIEQWRRIKITIVPLAEFFDVRFTEIISDIIQIANTHKLVDSLDFVPMLHFSTRKRPGKTYSN